MPPRTLHTLMQFIALVALTFGVFLLFGIPWALTVFGFSLLVGSVVIEASAPARVQASDGDR